MEDNLSSTNFSNRPKNSLESEQRASVKHHNIKDGYNITCEHYAFEDRNLSHLQKNPPDALENLKSEDNCFEKKKQTFRVPQYPEECLALCKGSVYPVVLVHSW